MVDAGPIDGTHPVRRITRLAESIKPPKRHRARTTPSPGTGGPAPVPGRGLLRRRPRSPLSSPLAWALLAAVIALVALGLALLT